MADDGENADPPSDDEEFRNFMNSVDMIDMREENFYSSDSESSPHLGVGPFDNLSDTEYHDVNNIPGIYEVTEPTNQNENDENEIDLFNYDINLPLEHGYLGQLDHLQNGRIIYPDGTKLTRLPLVYLSGIILVPGQDIPFTFRHQALRDFFQRVVDSESKTFGIGYDTAYGTTAEIRNYSIVDGVANIFAEGRQRFRITSKTQQVFEIYNANVVILPEINLRSYFAPLRALENNPAYRQKEFLSLSHFSELVHRQFDDTILMIQLRALLEEIIEQRARSGSFCYPEDPAAFSYFFISNIPFSDKMKSKLLQCNVATERLRLLYALLLVSFQVQCAHCGQTLANKKDFLVMSKRGTGGTFVNPSGVVHELFTFSRASNIESVSEWSDEFSWFPNYGWIITRCRRCMLHLGWKFETKNANIHPKSFWAVTRTAIKLSFESISKENIAYDFVHDDTPMDISHWNPNFQ